MHKIDIPDWVKDHVMVRRGAVHAFAGMVGSLPDKTLLSGLPAPISLP